MIHKFILVLATIIVLSFVLLVITALAQKDDIKFEQKKEILQWINACPKDATLSMKSGYHYDKENGTTAIVMLVCQSPTPKVEL